MHNKGDGAAAAGAAMAAPLLWANFLFFNQLLLVISSRLCLSFHTFIN